MLRTVAAAAAAAIITATLTTHLAAGDSTAAALNEPAIPTITPTSVEPLGCRDTGEHAIEGVLVSTAQTQTATAADVRDAERALAEAQSLMREGTGGELELAIATDEDCRPVLRRLTVEDTRHWAVGNAAELEPWYEPRGRRYIAFVNDAPPARDCGQAYTKTTDRSALAAVYRTCWAGHPVLHELLHTFGAVPSDAPNSTGANHCTDGVDVMCYDDGGPRGGEYHEPCSDPAEVVDCNRDDYFDMVRTSSFVREARHPEPAPEPESTEAGVGMAAPRFWDTHGHTHEDAIRWAASEGIVEGYTGGRFRPNEPITRAQMAAMLHRYHQGQ